MWNVCLCLGRHLKIGNNKCGLRLCVKFTIKLIFEMKITTYTYYNSLMIIENEYITRKKAHVVLLFCEKYPE